MFFCVYFKSLAHILGDKGVINMNRFSLKMYGIGLLWTWVLVGIMTIILTFVMFFTDVSEAILPATGRIMRMAAVFIGSIIAAKRSGSKGLFYGAAIAGTMLIILGALGSVWQVAEVSWLGIIGLLLAGIFGGMVGIGLSE